MDRILNPLDTALKVVVRVLVAFLLCTITVQIVTRYLFGFTLSFSEELARYTFVWIVFLSMPIVARATGHMAVDLLPQRLRGAQQRAVLLASHLITILFLVIMVYHGAAFAVQFSYQTVASIEISMIYVYLAIPVGFFLMLLTVIQSLAKLIRSPVEQSSKEPSA